MKSRSKLKVSVRGTSITSIHKTLTPGVCDKGMGVDAETEARISFSTGRDGRMIVTLSGKGLYAKLYVTKLDENRIRKKFIGADRNKRSLETQTVFFPRKVTYGAER